MKKLIGTLFLVAAVTGRADVSNVTVEMKEEVPHLVTVTYELSQESIVTAAIFVNTNGVWEKLSGAPSWPMGGDVNRKVAATDAGEVRTIFWSPDEVLEGVRLTGDQVKVEVTAWAPATPPDYMVIDLRTANDIRYYAAVEDLPGNVGSKLYKSEKLVMRRIPAKDVTWLKGVSPKFQSALQSRNPTAIVTEKLHKVKLTHDYYFAIYPVTVAQWDLVVNGTITDDRRPKCEATYRDIRGSGANGTAWPAYDANGVFDKEKSHAVDDTNAASTPRATFLSALRAMCGLPYVDLPTEAQWEYACRAGHEGLLCTGEEFTQGNFSKIGRCYANYTNPDCEGLNAGVDYATVGTYQPNDWGLYDLQGSGYQWCLDWYESFENYSQAEIYVDPVGPKTGTARSELGDRTITYEVWRDNFIGKRHSADPNDNVHASIFMVFRLAMTLY